MPGGGREFVLRGLRRQFVFVDPDAEPPPRMPTAAEREAARERLPKRMQERQRKAEAGLDGRDGAVQVRRDHDDVVDDRRADGVVARRHRGSCRAGEEEAMSQGTQLEAWPDLSYSAWKDIYGVTGSADADRGG